MPPASVLSPLAAPFIPTALEYQYESFSSIYTDGMLSLVCVGDHPEHESKNLFNFEVHLSENNSPILIFDTTTTSLLLIDSLFP